MLHLKAPDKYFYRTKPCKHCGGHDFYRSSLSSCVQCTRLAAKSHMRKDLLSINCFVESWKNRVKKRISPPKALPWVTLDKIMARR